jgi:rhodanese-related sulfurtransferase
VWTLEQPVSIPSSSEFFNRFNLEEGLIIDLRRAEQFRKKHIRGAFNKDLMRGGFMEFISQLRTTQPIFLYCTDGSRSTAAIRMMKEMGFSNLFHLENGIKAWDGPVTTR